MQIQGLGGPLNVVRLRTATPVQRVVTDSFMQRAREDEARELLGRLRDTLERLVGAQPTVGMQRTRRDPVARSTSPLGLVSVATPARLASADEVNVLTTSYAPAAADWAGASLAPVAISGEYDGTQGSDQLTVEVTRANGTGGGTRELEVRTSGGSLVDTVAIDRLEPPGVPHPIANGLVLTVGSGPTFRNDTFTIDVAVDTSQTADPNGAFDGSGGTDPNFDAGTQVTAGTFTINGTQIDVQADDTINSVLAQITANTDVTASFDAAADAVVLTQKTAGATPTIVLGTDTSGFLDAVKLSGATLEAGTDSEHDLATLDEVAVFSGMQSGTLTVNDQPVSVDVANDSLVDVLARIEAGVPGVSAGYLLSRDQAMLQGPSPSLRLDDGNTGFFVGLHIAPDEYFGRVEASGVRHSDRRAINADLRRLVDDLGDFQRLRERAPSVASAFATSVAGLLDSSGTDGRLDVLGLGHRGGLGLDFGVSGARRLETALRRDPVAALQALYGDGAGSSGLLDGLLAATRAAISISDRGL